MLAASTVAIAAPRRAVAPPAPQGYAMLTTIRARFAVLRFSAAHYPETASSTVATVLSIAKTRRLDAEARICRSASPAELNGLSRANVTTSRCVINRLAAAHLPRCRAAIATRATATTMAATAIGWRERRYDRRIDRDRDGRDDRYEDDRGRSPANRSEPSGSCTA